MDNNNSEEKTENYKFFKIQSVSISHAIKQQIKRILIVYFVIVPFTC